jgi:hypothetical protein
MGVSRRHDERSAFGAALFQRCTSSLAIQPRIRSMSPSSSVIRRGCQDLASNIRPSAFLAKRAFISLAYRSGEKINSARNELGRCRQAWAESPHPIGWSKEAQSLPKRTAEHHESSRSKRRTDQAAISEQRPEAGFRALGMLPWG